MNKVWGIAGVILFLVLMLGAWLFIVDFGGVAQFLGNKTKQAIADDQMRFVGTWAADEFGSITFFATQTYRKGAEDGTWKLRNDTLVLYELDASPPVVLYHFSFSENDTILHLSDVSDAASIILTRQN